MVFKLSYCPSKAGHQNINVGGGGNNANTSTGANTGNGVVSQPNSSPATGPPEQNQLQQQHPGVPTAGVIPQQLHQVTGKHFTMFMFCSCKTLLVSFINYRNLMFVIILLIHEIIY